MMVSLDRFREQREALYQLEMDYGTVTALTMVRTHNSGERS